MNAIQERVHICRLIEKIERNKTYSKKLGLENISICRKRNDEFASKTAKK